MEASDYLKEKEYRYNERLALLGCYGIPPAHLHNIAVQEADEHIAKLRAEERSGGLRELINLRDTL